jgi:hypothetical protein
MTAFDHVVVLLSFVYAFAFTHLLSRIGEIINGRERVVWSGLLAVAVINAAFNLLINWLAILGYRNQTDWTLLDVLVQLSMAVSLYFWCYVALPDVPKSGTIDLEAMYWRQRRPLYIVALCALVAAFAENLEYLKTPNASIAFQSNVGVIAATIPVLLALLRKERWAQWAGGVGLLAVVIPLFIVFVWKVQ